METQPNERSFSKSLQIILTRVSAGGADPVTARAGDEAANARLQAGPDAMDAAGRGVHG
jgi:hypothetical protein